MRKAGFTLLELTTVIIILSILAAIAYTSYNRAILNSKKNLAISNADLIRRAEKIYYIKYKKYYLSSNVNDLNQELDLNLSSANFTYDVAPYGGSFKIVVETKDGQVRVEMDSSGNIIKQKP